jgi:hypothetical protein
MSEAAYRKKSNQPQHRYQTDTNRCGIAPDHRFAALYPGNDVFAASGL